MKRKILAAVFLLSLVGLAYIQFHLLVVGVRFEKLKLDRQVEAALSRTTAKLNRESELGKSLIQLLKVTRDYYVTRKDSSFQKVEKGIQEELRFQLGRYGLEPRFSFAITSNFAKEPVLVFRHPSDTTFQLDQYRSSLMGFIMQECHCNAALHLFIPNLFRFLLGELNYLIWPSALFLLFLLGCLLFLIRSLRKEEKLNQIKNDFINNLTHELKTPVFSISLAGKIWKEKQKGTLDPRDSYVELMLEENEKLKVHIEKVLELASLESGRHQLKKEPTDVHELILKLCKPFRAKMKDEEGSLTLSLNATNKERLIDPAHFGNAIQNLLDNALKYSNGRLEIEVHTENKEGGLLIEIKDNGMGLALEHQKLIFDKFYRVPQSDASRVKGFGLGLHYVRQVVEAHRGTISVESTPGKGTTFSIALPGGVYTDHNPVKEKLIKIFNYASKNFIG